MVPLIVLVGVFVVLILIGRLGVRSLRIPWNAARFAFAAMFLLTASAHFASRREDLIAMVPPQFQRPDLIVTITGFLEIFGAIGLMVRPTVRAAAGCLALLLLAMFPANVYAAMHGMTIGGTPATALVPRTLMQLFFVAGLLMLVWPPRRFLPAATSTAEARSGRATSG